MCQGFFYQNFGQVGIETRGKGYGKRRGGAVRVSGGEGEAEYIFRG